MPSQDDTRAVIGTLRVYLDWRDWWVGYYRGDSHHYVCPLPCLVVRWNRRLPRLILTVTEGDGTDESVAASAHAMIYGGTNLS